MYTKKASRWTAAALLCCCFGTARADVDIAIGKVDGTLDAWAFIGALNGSQVVRFNFEPLQLLSLNYVIIVETEATGVQDGSFASGVASVDGSNSLVYEGLTDTNSAQYTFNGLLKGASHSIALDFSKLAFTGRQTTVSVVSNPLVYRQASPVPEPAGWALLLLGLPLVARAARRLPRERSILIDQGS